MTDPRPTHRRHGKCLGCNTDHRELFPIYRAPGVTYLCASCYIAVIIEK